MTVPARAAGPAPSAAPAPAETAAAGRTGAAARAAGSRRAPRGWRAVGRFARRHAVFLGVAAAALAARALVLAAYPPALMYLGDSAAYLDQAWNGLWPADWRPSGYPMFLRLVDGHEHLTRLVAVQHLLTFAVGVGAYAAALRVLGRPWAAALVAVPPLLAPFVLSLGQFVLAETLFSVLVTTGLLLVARVATGGAGPGAAARPGRDRRRARTGRWAKASPYLLLAIAGVLLGASLTVRTVGYGPLAVATVGVIVIALRAPARVGRAGGGAVAVAIPSQAGPPAGGPGDPAGAGADAAGGSGAGAVAKAAG
ncbi:MAG: hypothetical protein IRZ08_20875, partial [Frankia sp.]|nr:hypothetical protein [Frankia sp.]